MIPLVLRFISLINKKVTAIFVMGLGKNWLAWEKITAELGKKYGWEELMSLILYYQSDLSLHEKDHILINSCVKKNKKEPQERSGRIRFLLEIKTCSWKNLQAS